MREKKNERTAYTENKTKIENMVDEETQQIALDWCCAQFEIREARVRACVYIYKLDTFFNTGCVLEPQAIDR